LIENKLAIKKALSIKAFFILAVKPMGFGGPEPHGVRVTKANNLESKR